MWLLESEELGILEYFDTLKEIKDFLLEYIGIPARDLIIKRYSGEYRYIDRQYPDDEFVASRVRGNPDESIVWPSKTQSMIESIIHWVVYADGGDYYEERLVKFLDFYTGSHIDGLMEEMLEKESVEDIYKFIKRYDIR